MRYGTLQKQVNLVPADQAEHILWDGGKMMGVIRGLKDNMDRQLLDKATSPRLVNRAIKLLDQIENKMATIVKRTPLEMGLIRPVENGFELTEKGELEIALINSRDQDAAMRVATSNSYLSEGVPPVIFRPFGPLAAVRFLRNESLWVRKYRFKLKRADEGMAIWAAYMHGAKNSPLEGIDGVIRRLLKREDSEDVQGSIEKLAAQIEQFFPVKDDFAEAVAEVYKHLLDASDAAEAQGEASEDEDLTAVDIPFNEDGDELFDSILEQMYGSHINSSDSTDKRRAYLFQLFALRHKIKSGEIEKSQLLTIYDDYIRGIVDHYTGRELLGTDQDYVTMALTEDMRAQERDNFPYDTNITRESIRKYNPKPECRDILKDTVIDIVTPYFEEKDSDQFEAKFFKPVPRTHVRKQVLKAGTRQIVKKQYFKVEEFNHEMEADWEVNTQFTRVGDYIQWRANMIFSSIFKKERGQDGLPVTNEIGKAHLDKIGRRKFLNDHFELLVQARYLKALFTWEVTGHQGPAPTVELMRARCEFYYDWKSL